MARLSRRGGPLMGESVRASWRDSRAAGRCWASKSTLDGETLAASRAADGRVAGLSFPLPSRLSRVAGRNSRWISVRGLPGLSCLERPSVTGFGFGYDYTTKRFTVPNEVRDEYLKVHPKDANLRYGVTLDYEDLEIAVGNGVVVGKKFDWVGELVMETDAIWREELEEEEMDEEMGEEIEEEMEEELYEQVKCLLTAIQAAIIMLRENMIVMHPLIIKGRDVSSYRNHHSIPFQNVLAACNFDLEFIYVLSGWEGSAHDSKLLNDVLSRRNGLEVPQGKYFLVDCGFANRRQFLAPLRGVRYHLKDFGGEGRHPKNASELFNLRHASLRNVIERIFGIFKSRLTIFKVAPPFPFQTQAESPRNDDEDEEDNNEDQDDDIMNNEEYMIGENQEIYDVNEVEIAVIDVYVDRNDSDFRSDHTVNDFAFVSRNEVIPTIFEAADQLLEDRGDVVDVMTVVLLVRLLLEDITSP
ncbi:hypothetical protein ACLB2K_006932 [Fragaria x ananassa]